MSYSIFVALGIILAFVATRLQPEARSDLTIAQRNRILMAAVVGAVAGAYLCELPADVLGWSARPDGIPPDALPLGGRTVVGGLLGGWLVVELVKLRSGIQGATGDRFALPLALALAAGRLGCANAGCCGGVACDAAWAWHGRVPVQFIEVLFHGGAATVLGIAAWKRMGNGMRLAAYLTCYAVLRFILEFWRGNPPVLLSLTWYQLLAVVLFLVTGCTWFARWRTTPPTERVAAIT